MTVTSNATRAISSNHVLVIRAAAALWTLFFAVALVVAHTDLIDHHGTLGRLVMWGGHEGNEYLTMVVVLNLGVSIPLLLSTYRLQHLNTAVGIFVFTQTLHMISMTLMALQPGYRAHLLGDVPAGWLAVIVVTASWWPIRKELRR